MILPHTTKIVESMKGQLVPWPELCPGGPSCAKASGIRFLAAIGLAFDGDRASVADVHAALDEWLLSSERQRLSKDQRAICGCSVLELFSVSAHVGRTTPSLLVALANISPAVDDMSTCALVECGRILDALHDRTATVELSDFEASIVAVAGSIVQAIDRDHDIDGRRIAEAATVIKRDADDADVRWIRRIMRSVLSCKRLPHHARAVLLATCPA